MTKHRIPAIACAATRTAKQAMAVPAGEMAMGAIPAVMAAAFVVSIGMAIWLPFGAAVACAGWAMALSAICALMRPFETSGEKAEEAEIRFATAALLMAAVASAAAAHYGQPLLRRAGLADEADTGEVGSVVAAATAAIAYLLRRSAIMGSRLGKALAEAFGRNLEECSKIGDR